MRLNFKFELINNPYNDSSSKYLIWGKISLIHDGNLIFEHQWDILEVIKWFFQNKNYLFEDFPFNKIGYSNIFELRNFFYDKIDIDTPIEYVEKLEDYFSNHNFRLRGTPLGTYYLGVFNNNLGQISFQKNDLICFLDFDMDKFVIDTEENITTILKQWNVSPCCTQEARMKLIDLQEEYNFSCVSITPPPRLL